jgi:hypothetical protein
LNEVIDRIAGLGATPEPSDIVASNLESGDVRRAAIIHLAALLEAEPSGFNGDKLVIGGLSIRLVASNDLNAIIRYNDVGAGFEVEGASIVRSDGPASLGDLLYLYYYARDRSDTLLHLPQAMRNERIAALSKEIGASERFVRYVLARYHTLSARAGL